MKDCPDCKREELEKTYFAAMLFSGVFMVIVGGFVCDDYRNASLIGLGGAVFGALATWLAEKLRRRGRNDL